MYAQPCERLAASTGKIPCAYAKERQCDSLQQFAPDKEAQARVPKPSATNRVDQKISSALRWARFGTARRPATAAAASRLLPGLMALAKSASASSLGNIGVRSSLLMVINRQI